ncbi:MAG: hypothetical protein ACFFCH_09505 [Promethearchaeota archaeon]
MNFLNQRRIQEHTISVHVVKFVYIIPKGFYAITRGVCVVVHVSVESVKGKIVAGEEIEFIQTGY